MKLPLPRLAALAPLLTLLGAAPVARAQDQTGQAAAADPGWPRVYAKEALQLTVYQPQIDNWDNYRTVHFRCAIRVEGVTEQPRFGVAEIDASTVVDQVNRVVKVFTAKRDLRFAGVSSDDSIKLDAAVEALFPQSRVAIVSLDRALACLDPDQRISNARSM